MFQTLGTPIEKIRLNRLLTRLKKTETGRDIVEQLKRLLGYSVCLLRFDKTTPLKGLCEFKRITINPTLLPTQNDQISTLGHELAHATTWDIYHLALHNASSLDDYALARLLWETYARIKGDLILQELSPQKNIDAPSKKQTPDLTTKKGRTLYLTKALNGQTGWAEFELQKLQKLFKTAQNTDPKIFKNCCAKLLTAIDTSITLNQVIQIKPYTHFITKSAIATPTKRTKNNNR